MHNKYKYLYKLLKDCPGSPLFFVSDYTGLIELRRHSKASSRKLESRKESFLHYLPDSLTSDFLTIIQTEQNCCVPVLPGASFVEKLQLK